MSGQCEGTQYVEMNQVLSSAQHAVATKPTLSAIYHRLEAYRPRCLNFSNMPRMVIPIYILIPIYQFLPAHHSDCIHEHCKDPAFLWSNTRNRLAKRLLIALPCCTPQIRSNDNASNNSDIPRSWVRAANAMMSSVMDFGP